RRRLHRARDHATYRQRGPRSKHERFCEALARISWRGDCRLAVWLRDCFRRFFDCSPRMALASSNSAGGTIMLSRREFLASSASLALTTGIGGAHAAMGPSDKFDLVIKGGEVLDPSQSLRGRRDVGIRYGVVEAGEPGISHTLAVRVINASGKLVTPGLVDLHSHVYPYGSAIGIPADESVVNQCATTCVSAGDAGANNFAAFRRFIVGQTRTRLYAFVHIANVGLTPFPV